MIKRFKLEDLIIQDESGVVFRALDSETGNTVALRRFFPFGADGDGLQAEAQIAYGIVIGRLAGLSHPALRGVVSGGCDPVDGMPFIVTEWVEGQPLKEIVEENVLQADTATLLISQALEVSELLSHILAEEGIWVETDLQTILVSHPETGRGFTFWISPLKWLGEKQHSHGLDSVIALTERVMGWEDRIIRDHDGSGLGGWLAWLRKSLTNTTLQEAREALAASVGAEPPPPITKLVVNATLPTVTHPSKAPLLLSLILGLMVAGLLVGWALSRIATPDSPINPTDQTKQSTPGRSKQLSKIEQVNRRIAALSAETSEAEQAKAHAIAKQQTEVDQNGGVFQPMFNELMKQKSGKPIVVEGVLGRIAFSESHNTMYLIFKGDKDWDLVRGAVTIENAPPDLSEDALQALVGKKLRLRGKLKVPKVKERVLPQIPISTRASIEDAE